MKRMKFCKSLMPLVLLAVLGSLTPARLMAFDNENPLNVGLKANPSSALKSLTIFVANPDTLF